MGFPVGMTSNGTFIDGKMSAMIRDTGLDSISISLDGIGEIHDRFRRAAG